ncbi:hypothetical protein MMC07_007005 [Pseudocyphellaria aurata]|nr:hypothetical protein [Pseudocyphellaria aurata]
MQLVTNDVAHQYFDRETFIKILSAILCGAELWKQLNLRASLVLHLEDEDHSCPSADLCFSLSHLRSTLNSAENSDINILLPAHDIEQPFGVPFALLEHIQMTFIFSSLGVYPNGKRIKLTSSEDLESHVLLTDNPLVEYLNRSPLPRQLIQTPNSDSLGHDQQLVLIKQQSENSQELRYLTRGVRLTSNLPLFKDCILGSPFQSPIEKSPPMKLPGKRAASDYLPNAEKIILADLVNLFDAGLRTMICGDKIQPVSGVISSTCSGPKLAQISPAIFRPGYLPAIWEHQRFFDTIAYTTSMIYSHQRSVSLRNKIETLKRFPPDEFEGNQMLDERMPRTPEHALINAVKVRLWRMIVSQSLCRPGVSIIKPLDWTDGCLVRSENAQIMLGESPSCSGTVARSSDVGDVLLFGHEGEESDGQLENEILFREDGLDSENDDLDEDLLCGDCMTMEALDVDEEDWVWEGQNLSTGAGDRNVRSDSDGEILFEDDEDILLNGVVSLQEHDNSARSIHQAVYDEMLMSD